MPSAVSPRPCWSKLPLTVSASSGSPLLKVMPSFSVNVYVRWSSLTVQDFASHGRNSPVLGSCHTSRSARLSETWLLDQSEFVGCHAV